ncbi:PAS-domain containing protein [Marimonas arenosa]|uniref:PAS-domain containing protein n=1 Tax=Marimonas arenosa TaxID=1795305 RepID=A0AAE3WCX4_9RHOB|nr:PAS-domain containing protein [Marimonas arenosa]MDQ2090329.1 PAS-domain containing protein [Marimonas arenosa]
MSFAAMAALCLTTALLALMLFSRLGGRGTHRDTRPESALCFLLDGDDIAHATAAGNQVLSETSTRKARDWYSIWRGFAQRFPDLPNTAEEAFKLAPARLQARDSEDPAHLLLEPVRGKLRVELFDPVHPTSADRHLRIHHLERLTHVEMMANMFPIPVWSQSDKGRIDWGNKAYFDLAERAGCPAKDAVLPDFDLLIDAEEGSKNERRMLQDRSSGRSHWFSITRSWTGNGHTLGFAIDIDALIEAEVAQRKFVQTLTKTFAQLSTGLAIFDRERQLALFNPALVDLLALPADFLSARPTLLTFFDTLRNNRMMPEPKDYANWRHQITDLVIASVDGRYHETWTLPSGLTYRVTGRPHPDGAIALLFEDISAEVSLTRRFRSQLNLGQSVIDTLDEAIAVFSDTGVLTMSNEAFRALWYVDPDTSFAEFTIRDALRQWQTLAAGGPFWERLRDYFGNPNDRSEWFSDVTMNSGDSLECRVAPISGGATLVGFRLRPVLEPAKTTAGDDST